MSGEESRNTAVPTNYELKSYQWFDWHRFRLVLEQELMRTIPSECHKHCYTFTDTTVSPHPEQLQTETFLSDVVRHKKNHLITAVVYDDLKWKGGCKLTDSYLKLERRRF